MSAEEPGLEGQRANSVEELRVQAESLDESLTALSVREAELEEELKDEQRWIDDLKGELETGERERRGLGGFAPFRMLLAFVRWLPDGGFLAVGAAAFLICMISMPFVCEKEGPSPEGLVGVGSVMRASAGSAPIGAPCTVEVGTAVRQRCLFTIACGGWRYEEEQPCWQGSYEEDTGEGGTSTHYYLLARSSADTGWKFGFDERQRAIDFRGEQRNITILLHSIEGRGRIK